MLKYKRRPNQVAIQQYCVNNCRQQLKLDNAISRCLQLKFHNGLYSGTLLTVNFRFLLNVQVLVFHIPKCEKDPKTTSLLHMRPILKKTNKKTV